MGGAGVKLPGKSGGCYCEIEDNFELSLRHCYLLFAFTLRCYILCSATLNILTGHQNFESFVMQHAKMVSNFLRNRSIFSIRFSSKTCLNMAGDRANPSESGKPVIRSVYKLKKPVFCMY